LLDTEGRALCWPFSLLDVLRFNEIGAWYTYSVSRYAQYCRQSLRL